MLSHYEVLGIAKTATAADIEGAFYREMTKWSSNTKWNPNSRSNSFSEEQFLEAKDKVQAIVDAYDALGNAENKAHEIPELFPQNADNPQDSFRRLHILKRLLKTGMDANGDSCPVDEEKGQIPTMLYRAVVSGDCDLIYTLLVHGADPKISIKSENNRTALDEALIRGNYGAIWLLLRHGATLHYLGSKDVLRLVRKLFITESQKEDLLKRLAPLAKTALKKRVTREAVFVEAESDEQKSRRIVAFLESMKTANIIGMPYLTYDLAPDLLRCLKSISPFHRWSLGVLIEGSPLIVHAVKNNREDFLKILLEAGHSPYALDNDGLDAFEWAIGFLNHKVLALLLSYGVKPGMCDARGIPLVHHLFSSNKNNRNEEIQICLVVEMLLYKGLDPNCKPYPLAPVAQGNPTLLGAVLALKYNTEAKLELVNLLLEKGADLKDARADEMKPEEFGEENPCRHKIIAAIGWKKPSQERVINTSTVHHAYNRAIKYLQYSDIFDDSPELKAAKIKLSIKIEKLQYEKYSHGKMGAQEAQELANETKTLAAILGFNMLTIPAERKRNEDSAPNSSCDEVQEFENRTKKYRTSFALGIALGAVVAAAGGVAAILTGSVALSLSLIAAGAAFSIWQACRKDEVTEVADVAYGMKR